MSPSANRSAAIYAATTVIQAGGVFFAAMWVAKTFSPATYAQFAYVQALAAAGALLLDFGVGQAALRAMAIRDSVAPLKAAIFIKLVLLLTTLVLAAILFLTRQAVLAVAILASSLMSLNLTLRVYNVKNQDTRVLASSSILMVVAMGVGLLAAGPSAAAWWIALAVLVIPHVSCVLISLWAMRQDKLDLDLLAVSLELLRSAPHLFVSGVLFTAIVPLCLLLAENALEAVEFASLALAVSMASAVNMVVTAYRSAAYVEFAAERARRGEPLWGQISAFMYRARFFSLAYLSTGVGMSIATYAFYDDKYKGTHFLVAVIVLGWFITSLMGLFNIRYQALGYRAIEIVVNVWRFAIAGGCALLIAATQMQFALVLAGSYVLGELLYLAFGYDRARAEASP